MRLNIYSLEVSCCFNQTFKTRNSLFLVKVDIYLLEMSLLGHCNLHIAMSGKLW